MNRRYSTVRYLADLEKSYFGQRKESRYSHRADTPFGKTDSPLRWAGVPLKFEEVLPLSSFQVISDMGNQGNIFLDTGSPNSSTMIPISIPFLPGMAIEDCRATWIRETLMSFCTWEAMTVYFPYRNPPCSRREGGWQEASGRLSLEEAEYS